MSVCFLTFQCGIFLNDITINRKKAPISILNPTHSFTTNDSKGCCLNPDPRVQLQKLAHQIEYQVKDQM